MSFSAYYNSSRRSGRSRRFRVTTDSGERYLSLEERGSDLGGGAGGVWRRGRAGGRERAVGRPGAEVGSGGHKSCGQGSSRGRSGAEVTRVVTRELTRERSSGDEGAHEGALERSRRRFRVTKPEMLTPGKNPKASLIFGEKSQDSMKAGSVP